MAELRELVPGCTARLVAGDEHGSGFFVTPTVVLTCAHVVGDVDTVKVYPFAVSGSKDGVVEARVALSKSPFESIPTPWPDIALIRVKGYEHPSSVLLSGNDPTEGQRVVVTGYPRLGGDTLLLKPVACTVEGVALRADGSVAYLALQDGRIRPGHWGGPVYGPLEAPTGVVGVIASTTGDEHFVIPWSVIAACPELAGVASESQAQHAGDTPWRQLTPQPPPTRVVAATKKKTATFFGRRNELDRLHELLTAQEGRPATVTQTVSGLGGVGKTQLVAAYLDEHAAEFDVLGWVDAETDPTADLAQLGKALHAAGYGIDDPADQSPPAVAAAVVQLLAGLDVPWLLVFDNAPNPTAIADYLPAGTTGRMIVTSRDPNFTELGGTIRLVAFGEDQAIKYLTERVAGSTPDDPAAPVLARRLGGLPLALDHVRAYCAMAGISLAGYLDMVRADLPPAELFGQDAPAFYHATVATTWLPSINAATAMASRAIDVLGVLSWVAADDIPREILKPLVDEDTSLKNVNDAIAALASYSLITATPDALAIHRLVQDVVRDQQSPADDGGMPFTAKRTLEGLWALWPERVDRPSDWPQATRLAPHNLALATRSFPTTNQEAADLVELANVTSVFAGAWGNHQVWSQAVVCAFEVSRQSLEADTTERLTARSNYATWLLELGRVEEAIAEMVPLAEDYVRVLGADHPDTLSIRNNLAAMFGAAGRLESAIAELAQLVTDMTTARGADDPGTLRIRNNLASVLGEAGRVAEAIAEFTGLLADETRVLGADHPYTLATRNNRARNLARAGRVDEAITEFTQLLEDRTRVLGSDHPGTLATRNNLAEQLAWSGKVDEAITEFTQMLEVRTQLLGADHRDTLSSRNNLAASLAEAGRVDEAINQGNRLLEDEIRVLGVSHLETLNTRSNLVTWLSEAGRVDEAITQVRQLLEDRTRVLGADHPDTVNTRNSLEYLLGHRS